MEPLPRDVPQWQVWRYLPLRRLLTAIETQQLSLTLLERYLKDDPYETSVTDSTDQDDAMITIAGETTFVAASQISGKPNRTPMIDPQQRRETIKKKRRALLRAAYASYWRRGDESEAMWRLYCPGGGGVGICSTFEKLKNSIHDTSTMGVGVAMCSTFEKLKKSIQDTSTVVSSIAYIDYKTERFVRNDHPYDPALHKRKAFDHEQEVRVLRFCEDDYEHACQDPLYSPKEVFFRIGWAPETVVERIVVNPRCTDECFEKVKAEVKKLSPTLADMVQPSDLAKTPIW